MLDDDFELGIFRTPAKVLANALRTRNQPGGIALADAVRL